MLVHELRMSIAAQQNTKIIEPSNDALKLDTIDQEYCHGSLAFTDGVQENVLKVVVLFRHILALSCDRIDPPY